MEIVFKGVSAEGIDMGHHLRGRLVLPAEADGRPVLGPGAKSFQVRLGGAQGEPQDVFPWSIVRR